MPAGLEEPGVGAVPDGQVLQGLSDVAFPHADRDSDRLQHLPAVLPWEVRVSAETHSLFGRLVKAAAFKRLNGVMHLVIELPDGSPGTIRAEATDVFGAGEAQGLAVVLDADGLRRLRGLVARLRQGGADGKVVR